MAPMGTQGCEFHMGSGWVLVHPVGRVGLMVGWLGGYFWVGFGVGSWVLGSSHMSRYKFYAYYTI